MLLKMRLLTAAALLACCGSDLARAQSGVRPPSANDARQGSSEQRPAADDDALKAEQACEQARAHAARGADRAPEARKEFARGVMIYLRVYTKERPRARDAAVQTAFRERMRVRLKGAPRCVEDYLALGRGGTPFEREQLEAFGGQVSMLIEADEARAVLLGQEVDQPARIMRKPEPGFTEAARRNNVRGMVRLRAVLASDGAVRHVLVLEGLPFGMTEECVAAAKGIRFTPAVKNGRPVSQFVMLEYNFSTY